MTSNNTRLIPQNCLEGRGRRYGSGSRDQYFLIRSVSATEISFRTCHDALDCVTAIINSRGRFDAIARQLDTLDTTDYKGIRVIVVSDLIPGKIVTQRRGISSRADGAIWGGSPSQGAPAHS